jgi:hypothetical protein
MGAATLAVRIGFARKSSVFWAGKALIALCCNRKIGDFYWDLSRGYVLSIDARHRQDATLARWSWSWSL